MDRVRETLHQIKKTISKYGMVAPGDRIVVAVSGGPDSVCLLDILLQMKDELGVDLMVAHFDHGLRPEEDESETAFVRDLATTLNLAFQTEKASSLAVEDGRSLEEKAREARYSFLERVREKQDAQKIALGHNLNDQAETVIMRLLRGSGSSGLSGMPPVRDNKIIRPLIDLKREEIEAYLDERNLTYVTDSSNLATHYLRNKIRLELLPVMLDYQPRLIERLGGMADILRGENEYLEFLAKEWIRREADREDETWIVALPSLMELPEPFRNRIIRRLLGGAAKNLRRFDQGHIQSVDELARSNKPQGSLDLPNKLRVRKIYDRLVFSVAPAKEEHNYEYTMEGPGSLFLKEVKCSIAIESLGEGFDLPLEKSSDTAYLDAAKVRFPLTVRNIRPGDRFVPSGMSGHKKVKDFFIDLKLPSDKRASIPILTRQDSIIWICSHRIDDRYKAVPGTKKILKATISR